ncbi:MAG TPA: dipeptidase PepE [Bacteroidales bacterium]|nr:dipeptidase PepE [Bacteroidales bacterium]
MRQRLLLISNSTNYGETYLGWPRQYIKDFMASTGVKDILFVPYAGVGLSDESLEQSYNAYEQKAQKVFEELGLNIRSVHHASDPVAAVKDAQAIAVGGGNTFHLVGMMHKYGLMKAIRERVIEGAPYMGWSAGSNVACPSLRTTNDMPIYEPESFDCLNLIPFQINPHYLDAETAGHGGETRQQRIEEFLVVNRTIKVVGLREATLIEIDGKHIHLKGNRPMRLFTFGNEPREFNPGDDISFLLD